MGVVTGEYNAAPPLTMRQYEEPGDWGHAEQETGAPLDTLLIRRPSSYRVFYTKIYQITCRVKC